MAYVGTSKTTSQEASERAQRLAADLKELGRNVFGAGSDQAERLRRVEKLADWLDTRWRLPIVGWRFGGDTILGLIPGVGDTLTTGLGAYLIYEAKQSGASTSTLMKMAGNTAIDWVIGLVPLVGDLLDIGYKSNAKNARLLAEDIRRRHGELGTEATRRHIGGAADAEAGAATRAQTEAAEARADTKARAARVPMGGTDGRAPEKAPL